jgi:protein involved in polysaccharide export with SLBB domain
VNNHLGQGDANLELKIYSKDNRSWCYATTDQHGQFTSASLFPADYAIAVNSRDNPQLASAQVQSEQNSQLELHYDSPTTEPSSSQDSVENLEYRLAVAGSEIEATNMKLKLADVAARSGKPIPEDQRHRLDDQLKTLTDDQDRLQITLAMAQHEVFPSSQPTTVPSRPSDQPSLGATQQPDNQTVQFLNGFRIQISQTEARIVATKADLAQAKKELAADDPKIAALQKLLYQREDALSTLIDHAIQAENAIDGNSRDAAKTVPSNSATTQPDNISSAPLADLQSTLHALNLLRQNERSKLDATIHAGGDNRFAVEQAQATLKSIDEQRAVVSNYIAAKSSQPQAATTQPVAATANGIAPNSPATQPALPQTGEYYISGIPQSGVYAMNREPITVLQALIKAGMQDWTPDENLTVIHRDGGRQEFKLSDVMNGAVGQTPVQPDDVLMVANNLPQGEYYVGGDVPRVGVYSLTRRRINVLQALIAAGTDPEKIGNDIVVIRHRVGPDKETVQRIAIKELLNDPSKEIVLQPNDMLQVGPASTSQPTTHP